MKAVVLCCLFVLMFCASILWFSGISEAVRDIPEDNLGYPVLINTDKGKSASGFFLNDGKSVFLITARHAFYPPSEGRTFNQLMSCISYSNDPLDNTINHFILDLVTLGNSGDFKVHDLEDVAIIRIASSFTLEKGATPIQGVRQISRSKSGILWVQPESIKTFDQVLVANEVFLFGFPVSLGFKNIPQIDYQRPLLRKGIIAGKNETLHTLILDVPVYRGNSGGPVLEVETDGPNKKFRVVGIATQFVPSVLQGLPMNSGYSVAVPMNPVLELVASFE